MWQEKLKNGGLRLVDRVKVGGKVRRVSVPLDKDTPQALRRATEVLLEKTRQIAQGEEKTAKIGLYEAVDDYIDLKDCRESTKLTVTSELKHAKDLFGDVPLASLTPALIRRTFYKSNLKVSVVNRALKHFKAFLRWAVEMEYIESNPAEHVRPMKDDKPAPDPSTLYLEPDALKALLSNLHGMAYYMTRFLALTGMRIGEASALLPDDIGDKYISVTKAYSCNSYKITAPKNASSNRDIFIQPELRELIAEYLKWRNLDLMARGIRPKTLFYSERGEIYTEHHLAHSIRPYGAHPHILRHTHVALLAEKGMSLEAIARRIGHNGTGTTRAVYYHVTQKQRQKDEETMARIKIL